MTNLARFPSLLRRLRRDRKGVTAIEFGMVAPVLVLLIMGIVELGLAMGAKGILDGAVFAASRVGKTGYAEGNKTQAETITAAILQSASKYLDASKIKISTLTYSDYGNIGQPEPFTDANSNGKHDASEAYTDVNGNGKYDTDQGKRGGNGAAAEIVVYTFTYNWPLTTPLISHLIGNKGVLPLKSSIVVKNEPYS